MAHAAQFQIKGNPEKYRILTCEYEFGRPIKENGIPGGCVEYGLILLSIVSPDDGDSFLHDWAKNNTENHDGKIVFAVVDEGVSSIKTLRFEQAYCVRMQEYFSTLNDSLQMITRLAISTPEIIFGSDGDSISDLNLI